MTYPAYGQPTDNRKTYINNKLPSIEPRMRKQIVFFVSTKVIKLAILELSGYSLKRNIILGCYKQLTLILSHIKACPTHLLYKFLLTNVSLCDLGNFLEVLSLYPYKILKLLS